MTFKDIFGSLETGSLSNAIGVSQIANVLLFSILLGLYIFMIYRIHSRNSFYNKDFNISVATICIITAGIVLALQASLIISLGMVGALSIVRFRNAVKEPLDLIFLFWSISVGIICGAGLVQLAIILSLVVTVLLFVLQAIPTTRAPYLLVINGNSCDFNALEKTVKENTAFCKTKTKTTSTSGFDIILEVKTKNDNLLLKNSFK